MTMSIEEFLVELEEEEKKGKYAKATDKSDDGEGMDPPGEEDSDIDNDGDSDDSDEYLSNRRKAIKKAMKEAFDNLDESKTPLGDKWGNGVSPLKSGPFKLIRKASGVHSIMHNGKSLGEFSYDDEADNFVGNIKGMRSQLVANEIDDLIDQLKKHKGASLGEESDENLDETELLEADGWIAFYNGKKLEIPKSDAVDGIWPAKQVAIKHFKVPKSKQGLLAIKPAYND